MKKKSKLMAAVFALIFRCVNSYAGNAGTGIGYESFSSYLSSGSWE